MTHLRLSGIIESIGTVPIDTLPLIGYYENKGGGKAMADKITRKMTLLNKYGMHVRPAGLFAKTASGYDAEIEVEKDGNVVSGKSIMALMTLEAVCGTVLTVSASGPQAAEALDELEALVGRKFDIPDEQ